MVAEVENLSDQDLVGSSYASQIVAIKNDITSINIASNTYCEDSFNMPKFNMNTAQNQEFLTNIGAITCAQSNYEIVSPFIAFFGDKNKIMTYDLENNRWDLRNLHSGYEFNYYSASVTL